MRGFWSCFTGNYRLFWLILKGFCCRYLREFFEEEDVGVMTIKGVLYEICRSFGEKVWGFYKKIELKGTKNDYLLEK